MSTVTVAVVVGLFFLLIALSGIWLSRKGRPLHAGISTVHKLISLVAGIYLLATVIRRNRQVPLSAAEWIAVVVTGVCFLAMAASGAVLSSDRPVPAALLRAHQVVPVLTALSSALTLYLLLAASPV
jgi:hypothetical protein